MKQEIKVDEVKVEEWHLNPSIFVKNFVLIFIAQILLVLSTAKNATTINGVPRWIAVVEFFEIVALLLFVFTLLKLKKINKSFEHASLTIVIYIISTLFEIVLGYTKEPIFDIILRSLRWSNDILFSLFYIFYFRGCYIAFKENDMPKGERIAKVASIGTIALLLSHVLFAILSKTDLVMINRFTNRLFLYGDWLLMLVTYIFHFVTILLISNVVRRKIKQEKEGLDNGKEE
ncbi:MAG: hypothetical protein IJQ67_03985 [Bacilli bacterium]|nr:hypothetical protein [Bacilli bacterium]